MLAPGGEHMNSIQQMQLKKERLEDELRMVEKQVHTPKIWFIPTPDPS